MNLKAAREFGDSLRSFTSKKEAEEYFTRFSDHYLATIFELAEKHDVVLDKTPDSLITIESWYFKLHDKVFRDVPIGRKEFEKCMAMYFLHVAVNSNPEVRYITSEFAFTEGKYEFGVQYGSMTYNLIRCTDHFQTPNNKKRRSLYRTYKHYFMR